jgi:pimeloyl-ACP methyl ester carboxylesterase
MRGIYLGSEQRKSAFELLQDQDNQELIVFIHGFMGFMDWGAWHMVAHYFQEAGYDFCRFNLSHNGGTAEQVIDFPDPESFGNNTYSKELFDVKAMINHLEKENRTYSKIHLIGHSRGGGMAILAADQWQHRSPLGKVISWAGICDIGRRFPQGAELEAWKKSGQRTIKNSRTKQDLPQSFLLYEDYIIHETTLDILNAAKHLGDKLCIFHGDQDESVAITEAYELAEAAKQELQVLRGADHVFGAVHPWTATSWPPLLKELAEKTRQALDQ